MSSAGSSYSKSLVFMAAIVPIHLPLSICSSYGALQQGKIARLETVAHALRLSRIVGAGAFDTHEIGIDRLSLLDCRFSERRVVKTPRLEKIVISAMKQSRKAWKPVVNEMLDFKSFIAQHSTGRRFIAHCYNEVPRVNLFDHLKDKATDTLVLIGPEGDFSIDEVRMAVEAGFVSVDLGKSRLRTETAGLAAVMMMQLSQQ